jgi:hypothetical protein
MSQDGPGNDRRTYVLTDTPLDRQATPTIRRCEKGTVQSEKGFVLPLRAVDV